MQHIHGYTYPNAYTIRIKYVWRLTPRAMNWVNIWVHGLVDQRATGDLIQRDYLLNNVATIETLLLRICTSVFPFLISVFYVSLTAGVIALYLMIIPRLWHLRLTELIALNMRCRSCIQLLFSLESCVSSGFQPKDWPIKLVDRYLGPVRSDPELWQHPDLSCGSVLRKLSRSLLKIKLFSNFSLEWVANAQLCRWRFRYPIRSWNSVKSSIFEIHWMMYAQKPFQPIDGRNNMPASIEMHVPPGSLHIDVKLIAWSLLQPPKDMVVDPPLPCSKMCLMWEYFTLHTK